MAITEQHVELPSLPGSVRDARRFVSDALAKVGAGSLIEVASLLTSELVTNAIVHAGGPVLVRVSKAHHTVRVAVRDRSSARPRRRQSAESSLTGRGLGLVDRLAERWGADTETDGPGKVVWFELRC
jgi:anti-sigma regulatory factor (Ser/Thr protein kinase)